LDHLKRTGGQRRKYPKATSCNRGWGRNRKERRKAGAVHKGAHRHEDDGSTREKRRARSTALIAARMTPSSRVPERIPSAEQSATQARIFGIMLDSGCWSRARCDVLPAKNDGGGPRCTEKAPLRKKKCCSWPPRAEQHDYPGDVHPVRRPLCSVQ